MKRFAQYIRVSTGPQATRYGPTVQDEANRRYVKGQGGELVATYQDVDSGANPSRTGFDQLLVDGRAGLFDAVVAYKLGRVGRLAFISLQFAEELRRAGLEVHGAKTGAYNLKRPTDRFRYQMDAVFAEFEYENLIQNMYDAKVHKANAGGLPQKWEPFGRRARYEPDGRRVVEVYEPEAQWVRQAFEAAAAGMGLLGIVDMLEQSGVAPRGGGRWNMTTVHYMLRNRSYTGDLIWKFQRTEAEPAIIQLHVEPIITADLFDRVQAALAGRKRGGRRHTRIDTPLVGLLRCGGCGWRLNLTCYDHKRGDFRCVNRQCSERGYHMKYKRAEAAALQLMQQAALKPEQIAFAPTPRKPVNTSPQIAALRQRKARILEMVEVGLYTPADAKQRIAAIEKEITRLGQVRTEPVMGARAFTKQLKQVLANDDPITAMRVAGLGLISWRDKRLALCFVGAGNQ